MNNNRVLRVLMIGFFLAGLLLAACTPAAAPPPPIQPSRTPTPAAAPTTTPAIDQPRLRIKNAGATDIKNLIVIFPDSRITFGDVPAGATSEYQPAPKGVYNYAAYEYTLNGETVNQPVIDWVGESPRPGASYTYVLLLKEGAPEIQGIVLEEVSVP